MAATAWDLILVQNFYLQMEALEKCHYFWSWIGSSVHIDNKNKDITLDDTTLTAEAKYPINFTQSGKRFV